MGAPGGDSNVGKGKALEGYRGLLTILYAFADKAPTEVRHMVFDILIEHIDQQQL